ncbi:pseudouridine synthase [Globomyces pollinis-pini]|nr:pseudouridine synthase [Globomyces pollinis-pini]
MATIQQKNIISPKQLATDVLMGIRLFMNPDVKPFTGIIKHRYSDFHVHEVNRNNQIVYLSDLSIPEIFKQPEPSNATLEEKAKEIAEFLKSDTFANDLISFVNDNDFAAELRTNEIAVKEERTKFHQLVRQHFQTSIHTITEGNVILLKLTNSKTNERDRRNQPRSKSWKSLGGEYCHFTLYKENRDGMDVMNTIARSLRTDIKSLSYAGTKDKRAITTQRVSVHKVQADKVASLNSNKYASGIKVGNFSYEKDRVQLGDAKGNHFVIGLREVEVESEEDLFKSLDSLKNNGFINYFGMQRFGTRAVATFEVGILMLQEKWKEAVELLMEHSGMDSDEYKIAQEHWLKNHNPTEALKLYPRKCTTERKILEALEKQSKSQSKSLNYMQAISAIPKNMRSMYLHSYQSRIWNEMVNIRIERYGKKVVVGDIVKLDSLPTEEKKSEEGKNEKKSHGNDRKRKYQAHQSGKDTFNVKIVETEEEALKYDFFQVVLPMPGHSVLYPKNSIMEEYTKFMGKDNLNPLRMNHKNRDLNLPGDYRLLVTKPTNVSGYVTRYDDTDPLVDIIESDVSKLENPQPVKRTEGKFLAFVVEFTLDKSQYATMALREMTKSSTSAGQQTELSKLSEERRRQVLQLDEPLVEETAEDDIEPDNQETNKKARLE